jgi:ectoine hydroxylase-related dioxygenase (phytanoyl-CoA dioxygenase family)
VPGSHKEGVLPVVNTKNHYLDPRQYPLASGVACPAEAGDVLFFNYLTIHGSDKNKSSRPRRNFLIQCRDPEDLPLEGHEDDHVNWGQGLMICGENPVFRENVELGNWRKG